MTTMSSPSRPEISFNLPAELAEILAACPRYTVARSVAELVELSVRDEVGGWHSVSYDVPGRGRVVEAKVCRVSNGIAANYLEPYMRRRDPDCMVIGDEQPTNKPRYSDRFGHAFEALRQETFRWLKGQELALFPFAAGGESKGMDAVVVAPANAGFFALGLALLQGILDADALPQFATGRRVDQANLLLRQVVETPRTRYILTPNQHVGAWKVGFMPQWIAREYLARRGGARFTPEQVVPARCPLLGYALRAVMVEGQTIGNWFLRVEKQPEVGEEAYDAGAALLAEFFRQQLSKFLVPDLDPLGRRIIEAALAGATLDDYQSLVPAETIVAAD